MKISIVVKTIPLAMLCVFLVKGCAKNPVMDTKSVKIESSETLTAAQPSQSTKNTEGLTPDKKMATQIVALDLIYFPFDQSSLTSESRDILTANALVLKTTPALKVRIEGHCDSRGSDEYNVALGERRAQVVKDYLVSLGVAPDHLDTISYGEEMPTDSAMTEIAWAKNRHAEFRLPN